MSTFLYIGPTTFVNFPHILQVSSSGKPARFATMKTVQATAPSLAQAWILGSEPENDIGSRRSDWFLIVEYNTISRKFKDCESIYPRNGAYLLIIEFIVNLD